jgi:transcriptional regulator of arginine metabolism
MKKNKKEIRHQALTELISLYPIEDQTTLAALLKEKYNIETNQSIVSRDLRELGVTKKIVDEASVYEIDSSNTTYELLVRSIINIQHNESMIVVKTIPGLASFVGDFIDQQNLPELLATLAGENVVFVVPKSIHAIKATYIVICKTLHYKIKTVEDHNVK